jgi:hypothetical protein
MAENEYLDSSKPRRWHAVAEAICRGSDTDEIADLIHDCFCKTLRQISREVPLGSLIKTARDSEAFDQVCAGSEGAGTVKDFLRQAFSKPGDQEGAMRRFLELSLDNCLYDIPWSAQKIDGEISISETRRRLNAAKSQLALKLDRMAKKFAANPDWMPRRVASPKNNLDDKSRTQQMLDESLIAGFKR